MDPFNKLEIVNGIPAQCRCERHRKILEVLQILTKLDPFDVVDNIQERHTSTGIVCRLLCDVSDRLMDGEMDRLT